MVSPIKFIRASISNVSVAASKTVGGVAGIAYQWNATLTVTAQARSDLTTTPVANYYTGRNLVVGDWVTSDGTGKSLKIVAITSATDTTVACKLEDVDNFNAITDETGNLDGMIPNGPGIGAYVFAVKNSVPILGNIPVALPGNLAGTDFASNIQSRFAAVATVGIDPTTGKLDASILPTLVVGGAAGVVKIPSSGDFSVDQQGNLVFASKGVANGIASLGADGMIPASQLPSYVDDIIEAATIGDFPSTGVSGKIYLATNTGTTYRWSGSQYVEIGGSSSAVIGSAPEELNDLGKIAAALNNDPQAYNTLVSTTDSKIALAVTSLVGGASSSISTFGAVETALAAEAVEREASLLALQNEVAVLSALVGGCAALGDVIDGGSYDDETPPTDNTVIGGDGEY